jgi:hypothetical protein
MTITEEREAAGNITPTRLLANHARAVFFTYFRLFYNFIIFIQYICICNRNTVPRREEPKAKHHWMKQEKQSLQQQVTDLHFFFDNQTDWKRKLHVTKSLQCKI